jgi:hypothetical protein
MKISRRDSLRSCCGLCGLLAGFIKSRTAKAVEHRAPERCAQSVKHLRQAGMWTTSLIEAFDRYLDDASRAKILEFCGRACAHRESYELRAFKGDLDGLLVWTQKNAADHVEYRKDKGLIRIRLKGKGRCPCIVADFATQKNMASFCLCDNGYAKEVFEAVTGRQVEVNHEGTLLSGAKQCTVVVKFV